MKPLVLIAACLSLAACDTSGPSYRRVAGDLVLNDPGTPTITVPAAIRVGERVELTVVTQGSTCETFGDTEVSFAAGVLEVRPYDLSQVLRANEGCGFLLKQIPHTVEVTFPEAGPVIVRAVGALSNGTPQQYELGIVVR